MNHKYRVGATLPLLTVVCVMPQRQILTFDMSAAAQSSDYF